MLKNLFLINNWKPCLNQVNLWLDYNEGILLIEILQRIKIFQSVLSEIFIVFCQYILVNNLNYPYTSATTARMIICGLGVDGNELCWIQHCFDTHDYKYEMWSFWYCLTKCVSCSRWSCRRERRSRMTTNISYIITTIV